jgi:hypothetical protein
MIIRDVQWRVNYNTPSLSSPWYDSLLLGPLRVLFLYVIKGWEIRMSVTKEIIYFYNTETKESMWTPPKDIPVEEVKKFPGAEKYGEELKKLLDGEKDQVRASHLLIKHKDSRRPSSWKEVWFKSLRSGIVSHICFLSGKHHSFERGSN